jgi:ABC-type sugar transport system ATPase subunit
MNMHVLIPVIAVDELADVKAKIAELQVREKALVAALKALGKDRVIGTLHECTISLSERETVDVKSMPDELKAPYLRRTLVETLKVTGRKT